MRMECLISLLTTHPELYQRPPYPRVAGCSPPAPARKVPKPRRFSIVRSEIAEASSSVNNVRTAGVARRRE